MLKKFLFTGLFWVCSMGVLFSQAVPDLDGEMFGSLIDGRSDFFAAAIDDSTILVIGGFVGDAGFPLGSATRKCEYINVRSGAVTPAPAMHSARAVFASVVLQDSSILVFGGFDGETSSVLSHVELFDNSTRQWQQLPDMNSPRWQHTAAMLNDSLVLVAGGRNSYSNSTRSVDILNVNTRTFQPAPDYPFDLHNQVSLKVQDNKVLLFGGRDGGSNSFRPDSVYEYVYPNSSWNAVAKLPEGGFTLSETARLEDGRFVVAGGALRESPLKNSSRVFLWKDEQLSDLLQVSVPGRVYHELEVWDNRYLFVIGGLGNGGGTSAGMTAVDLQTGEQVLDMSLFEERSRHEVVQMVDERGSVEYFVISGLNSSNSKSRTIEHYFVPSCLVGHWSFDAATRKNGEYADLSGFENHATIHGDPRVVDGVSHEAVLFDGIDDFLVVPDNPSIQLPSFSVSLFVVYPERPSGFHGFEEPETYALFNKGGWGTEVPDSNNNYSISIDKNQMYLGYESRRNEDNNEGVLLPLSPVTEYWQHFAMTFDTRELKVYRNGQLVETLPSPRLPDICSMDLFFARNGLTNYLTNRFFYGALDEVRLYSCALSDREIESLYKEGERVVSVPEFDANNATNEHRGRVVKHALVVDGEYSELHLIDVRGISTVFTDVHAGTAISTQGLSSGMFLVVYKNAGEIVKTERILVVQ